MITSFLPKGYAWKRVWILEVWSENGCGKWHLFGLKSGQDLENRAAHLHNEFPGVPPLPPGILAKFSGLSGLRLLALPHIIV